MKVQITLAARSPYRNADGTVVIRIANNLKLVLKDAEIADIPDGYPQVQQIFSAIVSPDGSLQTRVREAAATAQKRWPEDCLARDAVEIVSNLAPVVRSR